jgi:hypothetical protein
MPENLRFLQAARVNAIMQALQDVRDVNADLVWSARIPDVDALDEEIMARFVGQTQIADLISDDAAAVVYQAGKFTFESTSVPNLKHGVGMTQAMLNQLMSLGGRIPNDDGIFSQYENRTVDSLLTGIRWRKEALLIAMLMDGFSYDRLGIKMSGVTWGMPSDLKITASVTWDNAGTATPVADLLTAKLVARTRYGITFSRVSMTTTDFRYMIATTEYQTKAKQFIPAQLGFANLQVLNLEQQQTLAEATLGMTIELNDGRYWTKDASGVPSSAPFHPPGKVILTSSANDGAAASWDFANGICTETIVAGLTGETGGMVGGLGGPRRGPIAYATLANEQLNPPGVVYWGVQRGFPRKHLLQSSACLTVGTYGDLITVSDVF